MRISARIVDETRLSELNIPHLDVVLDEIFHLPSPEVFPGAPPLPETVGELIARSGLSRGKVTSLLEEVRVRATDIEIEPQELVALLGGKEQVVLLDVREEW